MSHTSQSSDMFQVCFDMSLARGLDYYTGVIYEAILVQQPESLTKNEAGQCTHYCYLYDMLLFQFK